MNLAIFNTHDSELEGIVAMFFDLAHQDLDRLLGNAVAAEIFTGDSEKAFDHVTDHNFLLLYLLIMRRERTEYLEANGFTKPRLEVYEDFCVDDVREYFANHFIDILPLLDLFDIPDTIYSSPGVIQETGIGAMRITVCSPLFTIS